MQRTITYIVMALMTFSTGVAAVWLCSSALSKETAAIELNENVVLLAAAPAKRRFTPTFRGCKPGWVQGYVTSDGERLSESGNGFASPALAKRELQKRIQEAEIIIERGPRLDAMGKKVGERLIAVFPATEYRRKSVSIIWTYNDILGSINAPTLQLALEFEKHRMTK
jgi:hypothetical protein